MHLYRISKTKYASDISGEGARKAGGRWNLKGNPVIYTSDSTALATLEALIHTSLNLLPGKMSIAVFDLPDKLLINTLLKSDLPANWWAFPAPHELARIGSRWLQKYSSAALRVPSAVTPGGEGWNYLLNPLHPDFNKIKLLNISPYKFDRRIYKR
jgi:RES domain-containing protein